MNDQERFVLYLKHGAFYAAAASMTPTVRSPMKGVDRYPHLSQAFLKALAAIGGTSKN